MIQNLNDKSYDSEIKSIAIITHEYFTFLSKALKLKKSH